MTFLRGRDEVDAVVGIPLVEGITSFDDVDHISDFLTLFSRVATSKVTLNGGRRSAEGLCNDLPKSFLVRSAFRWLTSICDCSRLLAVWRVYRLDMS